MRGLREDKYWPPVRRIDGAHGDRNLVCSCPPVEASSDARLMREPRTTDDDRRHRHSPLHDEHVALGASFTDFAGWQMPLRYTSDLAEHHAVRTAAGLFDLSHMGEIWVTGPDAGARSSTTRSSATCPRSRVGRAQATR